MESPVFKTSPHEHFFFGYYDKSPFSAEDSYLLAQRASFIDRLPTKEDPLEIGFFDWKKNDQFQCLTTTAAWNWQQGCMLQWLGPHFNQNIIYNDLIDGAFVSVVFDIKNKAKRILPMSIYTVNKQGTQALCIDNERHHWFRRGYSYDGIYNQNKKKPYDSSDGIWSLDIVSGNTKQIINIETLRQYRPLSNMDHAIHYVEHLMFNPSGTRFCFLHRWKLEDGGIYARLYTADHDGKNMYLLNDSGRVSHFGWKNDTQILVWAGLTTAISFFRKYKIISKWVLKPLLPFYHKIVKSNSVTGNTGISRMISGDSYVLFNDQSSIRTRIFSETLNKDGHPTYNPQNEDIFITDTYPDDDGILTLILGRHSTNTIQVIDKLTSIQELNNSPLRSDLHPKWAKSGKFVCVDTLDQGCRSMYVYKIKNNFDEN